MNKRDWALLRHAMELVESGELDDGVALCNRFLAEDPNNPVPLNILCAAMLKAEKPVIAYQLAKRLAELNPREISTWVNLSRAAADLWLIPESIRAVRKGLALDPDPKQRSILLVNMAAAYIDAGQFDEAEKCSAEALLLTPDSKKARANLGFAQLGRREWVPGWENYRSAIGTGWRLGHSYADEPQWDGSPDKHVVLYGEQGLGDELSFASLVPDAVKVCKKLVLDVDKRLEGLFKRSFPQAKVYGTRGQSAPKWDREDFEGIDASLPMGQAAEYFRQKDEDFPGTPYLVPDPDRVTMWKALWATKKKPVIGVAWSGGIQKTGSRHRKFDLEQLLPLFQSVDAHFVSLQYRPSGYEIEEFVKVHGVDLKEYPQATLTKDYDDTAGLVASLDIVVCMQTAVGHLAGALGVPALIFVPTTQQWRYGVGHESMVWYDSVKLIRQKNDGKWGPEIRRAVEELQLRFSKLEVVNAH